MVKILVWEEFGDVTLACEGKQIRAHKVKQTYAKLMKMMTKRISKLECRHKMVITLIWEKFGYVTLACEGKHIGAHKVKQTYAHL